MNGQTPTTWDQWARLVRKTNRFPLISTKAVVKEWQDRVAITSGWRWLPGAVVLLAVGGGCFGLFYYRVFCRTGMAGDDSALPGLLKLLPKVFEGVTVAILVVLGLVFTSVGVVFIFRAGRVSWLRSGYDVCIRHGWFIWVREAAFPRNELEAVLSIREDGRRLTEFRRGHAVLSLRRADGEGGAVNIAVAGSKSTLAPAFEALRSFLRGDIADETAVMIESRTGRAIKTSRMFQGTGSASFKTMALTFPSDHVAVFRRTRRYLLANFGVFAVGIVGSIILPYGVFAADDSLPLWALVFVVIPLAFLVLGGLALFVGFGTRAVIADRLRRTLVIQSGFGGYGGRGETTVPFERIAAVQVCSGFVEDSEGPGYITYELNLVLTDPEGERIKVVSHAKGEGLFKEARRFAEFIDKPFVDHT